MSGTSPTLTLEVQADYASLAALQKALTDIQTLAGGAKLAGTGDLYQTQTGALLELKKQVSSGLSSILTMHEQSNEKILASSKKNATALARVAEHGSDLMVATRLKAQEQFDSINAEALAKDWAYGNKRVELAASMNMLKLATERQMQEKSVDQAAAMNLLKLTTERQMQEKSMAQAAAMNLLKLTTERQMQEKSMAQATAMTLLKLTTEREMQEKSMAQAKAMNLLKLAEERSMAQAHTAHLVSMAEKDIAYGQMELSRQIKLRKEIAAVQSHPSLGTPYVASKFAPAAIADARPIAQMEAALKAQGSAAHGAADGHNKLNGMMREGHSLARGMAGPLGAMWLTWGSLLPLLAGATLSAGISKAITTGAEFEMVLARIQGVSGETKEAVGAAGQEFKYMAENSALGSKEIASGAQILVQAGLDLESAVKALPTVLQLATVGELDMARAAEIATGTMNAFGLSVAQIPGIANVLSKAADISQTNIGEMGQAMQQASTIAQEYQVSLVDMSAGISSLAQVNIRGSAAGTAYKNMLNNLVAPSKKGAEELAKLGVSAFDAQGKIKDMPGTFTELAKALSKMTDAEKANAVHSIFTERGAKGALNYMRALNDGTIERFTADLVKVAETADYLEKKQALLNETVGIQGKMAFNALGVALIGAFESSQTGLLELTKQLKQFVQSAEFKQGLRDIVSGFVSLANALLNNLTLLRNLGSAWLLLKVTSWVSPIAAVTAAAYAAGGGIMAIRAGLLAVQGALLPFSIAFLAASALWFLFRDNANKALDEVDNRIKESIDLLDQVKMLSYVATQGGREVAGKKLDAAKANMDKAQSDYDKSLTAPKTKKAGNVTWDNTVANKKNSASAYAAYSLARKDYETAKEANQEVTDKLFKQQKETGDSAANLASALVTTPVSTENTNYRNPDKADSAATTAKKQLENTYATAIEKGNDFIRTQKAELAQTKQLSAAQKQSAEFLDIIADSKGKANKVDEDTLRGISDQILANDVLAKQKAQEKIDSQDALKAKKDYTEALGKTLEATYASAQSEQDRVDALQRQIDVFGLSEQAITALEAAKLNDAAATYTQQVAEMAKNDTAPETVAWVYAEIDAIKLKAKALENFGVKTTELDALKEAKKFTEDFVKSTSDGFRKIYDSITTGGGNVFKNLKKSAKELFFDWLYNLTLKKWVVNIATSMSTGASGSALASALGQVTGGAVGGAGASGGGALGTFSQIKDLLGGVQGSLTSSVASFGGFVSSLGSGGSGVISNGLSSLGSSITLGAEAISNALPYAGALVQLAQGNVKGAAFTAAGAYIGSIIPGVGTAIGAAVGSLVGSLFGGKKKIPRFSTERASDYQNGVFKARSAGQTYKPLGAEVPLDGLSEQFSRSLGSFLKGFGLNDSVSTTASLFKKRKASYGNFTATFDGGSVTAGTQGKAKNVQDTADRLNAVVLGSTLAEAIQKTNAVQGIKDLFKGLKEKTQVTNMISATIGLNEVQAELAEKYALNTDLAGKVSLASGEAGDALAGFVTKLSAVGLASRTVGAQIIKNTGKLLADFNTVFGDVVTEAVISTREVAATTTQPTTNRLTGLPNFADGLSGFGRLPAPNGLAGILAQFKPPVKQLQAVTEQVTTFIDRVVSRNLQLPRTIAEYDTLLKNIDKTSLSGQKMFAEVFALREDFVAKINTENGLKGNLRSGLAGIVSDAEKQKLLNEDLATLFGELKISVPSTIQDLIRMGQGALAQLNAGTATEATYNLASAFPNLISAFKATQEGVESLIKSLREENDFKTLYDYNFYKGLAGNYGEEFANRYVDGASVTYGASTNTAVSLPNTVPFSNNSTISSSDPIMLNAINTLISKFNAMQAELVAIKTSTASTAQTLRNVSPNGDAFQTELAA